MRQRLAGRPGQRTEQYERFRRPNPFVLLGSARHLLIMSSLMLDDGSLIGESLIIPSDFSVIGESDIDGVIAGDMSSVIFVEWSLGVIVLSSLPQAAPVRSTPVTAAAASRRRRAVDVMA